MGHWSGCPAFWPGDSILGLESEKDAGVDHQVAAVLRPALLKVSLFQRHPAALIGGEVTALPPLQAAALDLRTAGKEQLQVIPGGQQRMLGIAALYPPSGSGAGSAAGTPRVPLWQSKGR